MNPSNAGSPFVGPKPFEQGQADLFKGREHEIDRLEALVLSRRVILFYAASGVGKSSLINAGLIPKLLHGERGLDCDLLGVVRVSASSGSPSTENVFTTSILGQLPGGLKCSSFLDYLKNKYPVRQPAEATSHKLALLVVDQFEELFTTFPDRWRDRLPFMLGLLEALDACAAADPNLDRAEGLLFGTVHLRIVFCLREEYIAYLEQYYDLFPELRTARFRLEPLRREQAHRAILEPTRATGRPFSDELVQEIIKELIEAPQVTAHDSGLKSKNRWIAWLQSRVRRAFFHVPEVGHRDQQYVVEGEYVEPVQLQVICSDIWESADSSQRVISKNSLPRDWSVDVGLGRFYDQAIDFACRPSAESPLRASSIWSRLSALLGWPSFSSTRLRRWISKSLITTMGTRAPVLKQEAENEVPGGVLEGLQTRYLLRLEPRFGADWLELAHDRLVGPITRSNARRIAASNNTRFRLAMLALALVSASAALTFTERQAGERTREKLIGDVKAEIESEPDLAVLVQGCARSYDLTEAATHLGCPEKDGKLSADIIRDDGGGEQVTRQPELHAFVRSPFGAIQGLVRDGEGYRAILDKGKYFSGSFASPAVPSEAKDSASCAPSEEDASAATARGSTTKSCASTRGPEELQFPGVGAIDASREYAVAFECRPDCATKLKPLVGPGNDWALVKLDQDPTRPEYPIVRQIAASGATLLYAVCPEGPSCAARVYVYRLSDDRSTAAQIGALPGTFDLITMAASENNVAVAYRSVGGSIKVKAVSAALPKSAARWLPDGSRIFDVPFKAISSLLFNTEGDVLVAAAGERYLIDWDLGGAAFGARKIIDKELRNPWFAQSAVIAGDGNISVVGLGLSIRSAESRDLDRSCLDIEEFRAGESRERADGSSCRESFGTEDRAQSAGWGVTASDATASIIAAANPFTSKGVVLAYGENGYHRIEDVAMTDGFGAVGISADGNTIALGNRAEDVAIFVRSNGVRYERAHYETVDPSCVRLHGPQRRIAAIAFYPNNSGKVLVATQEGCLAAFERTNKGWQSQMIDMQMSDITSASIAPDSRWAAFGTGSGRIQLWDLDHPARPPAIVEARLPWSSSFAWLPTAQGQSGAWMLLGNSRFGPVGSWLVKDTPDLKRPATVAPVFPPTWIDKSGIVSVAATREGWVAATTDGRLLQFDNFGTPQAIVDRLIDRACEIAAPVIQDQRFPQPTAEHADFVGEIMRWSRERCGLIGPRLRQEARG